MAKRTREANTQEELQDAFLVGPISASIPGVPNVKPEMLKIERVGIGRAFFPQEGEYPCLVFEARNAAGEIQQVPVGSSAYIVVDAQGSRILASAG